jgi:hypothetical protein
MAFLLFSVANVHQVYFVVQLGQKSCNFQNSIRHMPFVHTLVSHDFIEDKLGLSCAKLGLGYASQPAQLAYRSIFNLT